MNKGKAIKYNISVLIFVKNQKSEFLLLKRNKSPNLGCWTPIGGKLHMDDGESPFECAIREAHEESGLVLSTKDLHLFSMVAEKNYENTHHWLLFLFDCKKLIEDLPEAISEGSFGFFSREAINELILPETDKEILWSLYDNHRDGFVALKADCHPERKLQIILEECH
jgi:8-oxo-dGTP diphosphatase